MESLITKFELSVLEGLQLGSSIALGSSCSHTVGNTLDCDIYLHDDNQAELQLEIVTGKLSNSVKLLLGSAILDNTEMELGHKYKLSSGVPIRLGSTLFVVVGKSAAVESSSTATLVKKSFSQRLQRPATVVLVMGCALLGTGMAAFKPTSAPSPIEPLAVSVEQSLAKVVGKDIQVTRLENGSYVVEGVMSSRADQAKLHQAMSATSETILDKTTLNEDVERAVLEVFGAHGVQADLKSLAPGRMVARTATADLDALKNSELAAHADVYGLLELNVINKEPVLDVVGKKSIPSSNNPGREIRLIMVGSPSYVITTDRSQYFSGSELPSGHRIESITKMKVVLSKSGITTELLM